MFYVKYVSIIGETVKAFKTAQERMDYITSLDLLVIDLYEEQEEVIR
jgi:hypothetical protein